MTRSLSDHERRLWLKVARSVQPMKGRHVPAPLEAPKPKSETGWSIDKRPKAAAPAPGQPKPYSLPKAPSAPPAAPENLNGQRRLRRGQAPIDARLDLHGHTQDSALAELTAFAHREHAHGARCLLIITGKGRSGSGVLRRRFLDWIGSAHLRSIVAGYSPAHARHGGEGAFYLLLKRHEPKPNRF